MANRLLKLIGKGKHEDKERFKAAKCAQDAIPIETIWQDGVFKVSKDRYSKCYRITDINYAVASREDKEKMFLDYSELLNSFDADGATAKITTVLRRLNQQDFEQEILIPMNPEDGLDDYRREYNDMLLSKATGSSSMVRELYITVATSRRNVEEAKSYFRRTGADLSAHLSRLGSKCEELDCTERLRVLHDFYRSGTEQDFSFDMKGSARLGHHFKDSICPDGLAFEPDYFCMGDKVGRVLFLRDYANYIKDSMFSEFTDLNRNMMVSIDVVPVATDEAVKEVEKRLLGVEKNITDYTRKQNENQNYNVEIPYDMQMQRKEAREFLDDLVTRDQRMMLCTVTLVHIADDKKQLDADTEAICTVAAKHLCKMSPLKWQQLDGLNTALPIGVKRIEATRTLTTECLATLMPFRVQEIMDAGGTYFGENAISRNLLLCNKSNLLNPNGFVLGVPGAGKSFITKQHIVELALSTKDDIIICDPEGEYTPLILALGGTVINIAAGSGHFVNAMDMVEGYGDSGNPVIEKSQFILSLFAQLNNGDLKPQAKSIIDRCVASVYQDFKDGGEEPTLVVLRDKLNQQPELEATELALSLELFTSGSLDAFARKTNVDVSNRIVSYDIMDLGETLKTMGLLVITDSMINRVVENWRRGRRTHLFIDEFHVLFSDDYSAEFFASAWRRFRKRNAIPTAITQNVDYLLQNETATSMLSNSEFIIMLNQAASDRDRLAHHLHISPEQMGYITNAEAGSGLIRYGSALVPFVNHFPKNTKLYKLMTTKPGEEKAAA